MKSRIQTIDPVRPQSDLIERAAGTLCRGGVVIFPTRGLYGLGCHALDSSAVKRIFHIKSRPLTKPLLVLISAPRMLSRIVPDIPPLAQYLMDVFWPGRMTLVMAGRKDLPPGLCSDTGKVGVRQVGHPVAAALVDTAGAPITGTSANLSGAGGCPEVSAIDPKVTASAEIILDAGPLAGGAGSSVVDVTGRSPRILREGAVPASEISKAFDLFAASHIDNGS